MEGRQKNTENSFRFEGNSTTHPAMVNFAAQTLLLRFSFCYHTVFEGQRSFLLNVPRYIILCFNFVD